MADFATRRHVACGLPQSAAFPQRRERQLSAYYHLSIRPVPFSYEPPRFIFHWMSMHNDEDYNSYFGLSPP